MEKVFECSLSDFDEDIDLYVSSKIGKDVRAITFYVWAVLLRIML